MKVENKKLIIGVAVASVIIIIIFVSFNFYQSVKNGLVARYINQKTAMISGEDIVSIKATAPRNNKAILDGYFGYKYFKNGNVVCGTFYFNGNFDAEKKSCEVAFWQILFVGREKK